MKPLLLALLLAAPLRAADTTGPSGPRVGAPAAGAGASVSVPVVPNLAAGVGSVGSVPGVGVQTGVAGPLALPAGVVAAPQAGLSGPEAAGPQGAPEAGKPSAVASPSGEQSAPQAAEPAESAEPAKSGAADAGIKPAAVSTRRDAAESGKTAKISADQPSAESQKAGADQKFDGSAEKQDAAPAVAAPKTFAGRLLAKAGLSRFTAPQPQQPKTPFDRDAFGGPQHLQLSTKGKLVHGMRWGLSLTGLATVIQLALGTLFSFFPWQLHVSKGLLTGAGRVELLVGAGPQALGAAIAAHPLAFFLMQLPLMTFKEELIYRGLHFGLTFLALSAIRPAAAIASRFVEKIPDLFGWDKIIQRGLKLAAKVSARAFPIAAALSAWGFATAHFGAWGIDPVTIAVHSVLGFSLAYVAYKTRSLTTAFVAHLSYNALSLGAVALAITVSPLVGMAYGLGLSVVSVAALYLHWRSYRKARRLALGQAKLSLRGPIVMVLLAAMLGTAVLGGGHHAAGNLAQQAQPMQMAPQQAAPDQKAPSDTIPPEVKQLMEQLARQLGAGDQAAPEQLEGLAAITARSKQSVAEVIDPGVGLGTGYIVSEDGLLLTNGHVVGDAAVVIVKLEDGSEGRAKVVAVNHDKDIAIVQLPKRKGGWPALKIAANDSLHEGDEVLAMGHPLGLPFSVSRGIVSGLGQQRGNLYVDHIQTDAAINHGNSGGPLISAKTGEIVGMNTEIASTVDANIGLGFSISAKDLRAALEQYRATGSINSSWAGILINTSAQPNYKQGIEVEQVRPGSPAAKAGLQPGDLILGAEGAMFGAPQTALHQLALTIARAKPGSSIVVAVGRDGEVALVKLALTDKPL